MPFRSGRDVCVDGLSPHTPAGRRPNRNKYLNQLSVTKLSEPANQRCKGGGHRAARLQRATRVAGHAANRYSSLLKSLAYLAIPLNPTNMFALFVKLSYDLKLPAVTGYIPQSTGESRLNELSMLAHLFDSFCCFSILEPFISQPNLHPLQATSTVRAVATNFPAPIGTHLRATSTTVTETGATLLATCVLLLLCKPSFVTLCGPCIIVALN